MAATDARPVPRKNVAFRFYFAVRKNDGTLITSWTGAASEVSIDGAAFAACTNEATEIGTTGCGYIDFTAGEMNGDAVVYKLTVTNASALPVVVSFFPEESGDYRADVTHFGGSAGTFSGGRPEVNASHAAGTAWGSGAITAASIAAAALNGKGDWNIGKTGYALSGAGVQAIWDALTTALTTVGSAGKLLVDNLNATVSSRSSHSAADVWAAATRTLTSGANIALAKGTGVTGFTDIDAAGVRTAVGLAAANLDTQLTTIDDFLDTEIAAILAAVDTEVAAILALLDDPRAEPGQGAPPVNPDAVTKIDYLYKLARNKVTQDATTLKVFADDATTVDHKATVSDDGTTYTRGELAAGP